jgi:hypothetical protein
MKVESPLTTFVAPEVEENTTFEIKAYKEGYIANTTLITVIDIQNYDPYIPPDDHSSDLEELQVTIIPRKIYSGGLFCVFVKDKSNPILSNVLVEFYNESFHKQSLTNILGFTIFTAPTVEKDESFTIRASKDGWKSTTLSITVYTFGNTYDSDNSSNDLSADVQEFCIVAINESYMIIDSVFENTTFYVIAINNPEDLKPIPDVLVTFYNQSKVTDENGLVQFTTPSIKNTTTLPIYATKNGYNTSTFITIQDLPQEPSSQEMALNEKWVIPILPIIISGTASAALLLLYFVSEGLKRKKKKPLKQDYASKAELESKNKVPYFEPIPEETPFFSAESNKAATDKHLDDIIDTIIKKNKRDKTIA